MNLRTILLASSLQIPLFLLAQQPQKMVIEIQRTDAGQKEIRVEEWKGDSDTDLRSILQEYGIEEGFDALKPGEEYEVIIRKKTAEGTEDVIVRAFSQPSQQGANIAQGRPLMGVTYSLVEQGAGMEITSVIPGSGADKAGLLKGDILISVDKITLLKLNHLSDYVAAQKPGDKVSVEVMREGKHKKFKVKLGEAPKEIARYGERHSERLRHQGPLLGVSIEETTDQGAKVRAVSSGSMASQMDLQPGDILLSLNGKPASSASQIREVLTQLQPGETLSATFLRDGEKKTVETVWNGHPAPASSPQIIEREWEIRDSQDAPTEKRIVKEVRVNIYFSQLAPSESQYLQQKTGIDFSEEAVDIQAYPNPSNGQFEVAIPVENQGLLSLSIFDSKGNELEKLEWEGLESGIFKTHMNLTDHASGIYYLLVSQNGKTYARRLVIQ